MGPLKPNAANGQVAAVSPEKQVSSVVDGAGSPADFATSISSVKSVGSTNYASSTSSASSDNSDEVSLGTVQQILESAKSQIQTEDTAQYYDKLIAAYNLDNSNTSQSSNGSGALSSLVDIQQIDYAAMSMPLIEAGKNITDEDISKFYYKLLQDSGWDIKP